MCRHPDAACIVAIVTDLLAEEAAALMRPQPRVDAAGREQAVVIANLDDPPPGPSPPAGPSLQWSRAGAQWPPPSCPPSACTGWSGWPPRPRCRARLRAGGLPVRKHGHAARDPPRSRAGSRPVREALPRPAQPVGAVAHGARRRQAFSRGGPASRDALAADARSLASRETPSTPRCPSPEARIPNPG